ncbi:MAG: hypothetical protein ACE5FL_08350 [Myxococcota bacterium]
MLLGRVVARLWVALAVGFHLGVLTAMAISFVHPLSGVAFLCFFPVERIPWLRRWAGVAATSTGPPPPP